MLGVTDAPLFFERQCFVFDEIMFDEEEEEKEEREVESFIGFFGIAFARSSALLAPAQLRDGMTALVQSAAELGIQVVDTDLALMPASRRQVEVLIAGDSGGEGLHRRGAHADVHRILRTRQECPGIIIAACEKRVWGALKSFLRKY